LVKGGGGLAVLLEIPLFDIDSIVGMFEPDFEVKLLREELLRTVG
jgi:hypothetical protein